MMTHARIDDDGFVIALLNGVLLPNLEQQSGVVPAPPGDTPGGHAWRFDDDLGWQAWPVRPSVHHVFDRLTKQWIDQRTLADFKAAKWAEIKRHRDTAEFATFTYNGMEFDGDLDAQRRLTAYISISKSAIAAGQPFAAEFILANNQVVMLTAQNFLGIELAKVQAVAAAFAHATALREQIEAATTAAELDALVW